MPRFCPGAGIHHAPTPGTLLSLGAGQESYTVRLLLIPEGPFSRCVTIWRTSARWARARPWPAVSTWPGVVLLHIWQNERTDAKT